ncbi:MAG TPA: glutaredoxin domain-containing protein [Microthrixaceae bacterium]|nr:glutaredoxin domain-containing protein [Microthrixaceae bacterium]
MGSDSGGFDSGDNVVVFWRPGCGYCSRLLAKLDKLDLPLLKVNIWDDPAAAAVVRSIANGSETVPTVIVGKAGLVNPSKKEVLAAVADQAPHLLGG